MWMFAVIIINLIITFIIQSHLIEIIDWISVSFFCHELFHIYQWIQHFCYGKSSIILIVFEMKETPLLYTIYVYIDVFKVYHTKKRISNMTRRHNNKALLNYEA